MNSISGKQELYVGCSLTHAPEDFKDEVTETKAKLAEDWEVMEFLGLTAGTPGDVYRQDIIENVGRCDGFVGICDHPSIGLGWELCESVRLGKPTLAVASVETRLTRLVPGAAEYNPNFRVRQYENMVEDVPKIVAEEFEVVKNSIVRLRSH